MPRKAGNLREKFIVEYLIDQNATQAAIRAGYSQKTAYSQGQRLLKDVEVGRAIEKAKQEQLKRTQITADYVLSSIRDTIERCKQAEPVYNREGEETGEYKFESFAVLKGCELLGKHLKLFTDKVEVDMIVTRELAEETVEVYIQTVKEAEDIDIDHEQALVRMQRTNPTVYAKIAPVLESSLTH